MRSGCNFAIDMRNDINIADEFATLVAAKVVEMLEERGLVMAAPAPKSKQEKEQSTTLYSVDEVCQRLKISKATLYRHRDLGYIKPSCHVGRSPRFTEANIQDYLNRFN
jgi:excisionase family DNA binding protein